MNIAWRATPPTSTTLILVLILLATQLSESDARRRVNRQAPSSLSSLSLSWSQRFIGAQLRLPRDLSRETRGALWGVRKRTILVGDFKPNQAYQSCIMPGDKPGRCRHLQYCVLEDFRASFPRFLDYMCIIERSYVGVCCPERPDRGDFLSPLGGSTPDFLAPETQPDVEPGPSEDSDTKSYLRGCGVSSKSSSRVVGGTATVAKQYPWVAALLMEGNLFFCGGVLVTDRHVLTAAHCVASFKKASDVSVRLGEYDLDRVGETRARDFQVVQIRSHLDFQKDTYENDIAVLKLHRPATFNAYIWPICLPPPDQHFENETAVVAGWGTQFFGGPTSSVLMEAPVPVWAQAQCAPRFAQPILDTMLCAAEHGGGKDACQGDSGGPLLYQLPNKRWATIGVVSWGIRCGEPQLPGVYTRVNRYLAWIYSNCIF